MRPVYGGAGVGVGWGYEILCVLSREGDVGAFMPKYSCLQVCCQSINLKMATKAETCG